jgi:3-phosphoshikimate 1-carboxyvinyltransferase
LPLASEQPRASYLHNPEKHEIRKLTPRLTEIAYNGAADKWMGPCRPSSPDPLRRQAPRIGIQIVTSSLAIQPVSIVQGSIRPPGSKSLTNRALLCAALAEGTSTLHGALDSEDTRVMIVALRQLGLAVHPDESRTEIQVRGAAGQFPTRQAQLYCANSGTTIRFLTAALTVTQGQYRLTGVKRMHQRPIGDLLATLQQLGGNVRSEADNDCPPVVIEARHLPGGEATIRGETSSQFLSSLLMACPYAQQPVRLSVDGPLVSAPYIRLTLGVIRAFGVDIPHQGLRHFEIPAPVRYRASSFAVEPDASAASYFWAAAAITGGRVTVEGVTTDALQGDVAFCHCLEQMGCEVQHAEQGITVSGGARLQGIDVDMGAISDTVQTLAAVALFADGPTTIRNVAHIRYKETDRIDDLARELSKLGATVDTFHDGLTIHPGPLQGAEIETYNDHRMAMSLALVGLRVPGVRIRNPRCTEKTYPHFFDDLQRLCGSPAE